MSRICLRAPGERRRPATADLIVHLNEPGIPGLPLHHDLHRLFPVPGEVGEVIQAALLTALAVWAADKILPRRAAGDAWTREITLEVPAPPRWAATGPLLEKLLAFLTGDRWSLKFREGEISRGAAGRWPHSWQPEAVVLFSGGLDSLAGAIDLLAAGKRLLLVSHYDYGQLAAVQQTLAKGLQEHFGADRLHHLALRLQCPRSPELTLRSRSFLYLTLGRAAAAAFGPEVPLLVPENGWISLNPPLTLNRLGPYSTRTTHPRFLAGLGEIWAAAGIPCSLDNPYAWLSKGEILARSRAPELLARWARLSVSCARPVASRWRGVGGGACGYCYPCLLRRAALNRVDGDHPGDYLLDALRAPGLVAERTRGADLRALLAALHTWQTRPGDIMARVLPPPGDPPLGQDPAPAGGRFRGDGRPPGGQGGPLAEGVSPGI